MSNRGDRPRWRRRTGPLGPHGGTAERLAKLYAGVQLEPLPPDIEMLLDRLDLAEAKRRSTETEQHLSPVV